MKFQKKVVPLQPIYEKSHNGDSLAQLVEHNTFNVGVLGSSPKRVTKKVVKTFFLFFLSRHVEADSDQQQDEGDGQYKFEYLFVQVLQIKPSVVEGKEGCTADQGDA